MLNITEIRNDATNIDSKDNSYIIYSNDSRYTVKRVVLCLGSLNTSNFIDYENVINHYSGLYDIKEKQVLLAGSGLTAVDFIRTLSKDPNKEIHVFSRNGYAPTCLTTKNKYIPKIFNWDNIIKENTSNKVNVFLRLLKEELKILGNKSEYELAQSFLNKRDLSSYFSFLMSKSLLSELPYQDILVSTRPYMHHFWNSIPLEQKQFFMKNIYSNWSAWRHPIPYEVISELKNLIDQKRLYIHKYNRLIWDNKFILETNNNETISSSFLIDGTGGSNFINKIDFHLIKNLLSKNLIEGHLCGGININVKTFECIVNGKEIPNLYNIGPLNKELCFLLTHYGLMCIVHPNGLIISYQLLRSNSMSFFILTPFLYLIIGIALSKTNFNFKKYASSLLTKWVIPLVIIYNISTYQEGVFTIIFGTMLMMLIMLLVSQLFTADPIQKLSFFYLNIGWLGLPIASSIWGEQAATIYIASYIGNSIFGNSISAGLLDQNANLTLRITNIIKSPPFIGLIIGILLIPFGEQLGQFLAVPYKGLKFLMSFLGMSILGVWIAQTQLQIKDIWLATQILIGKFILVTLLVTAFIYIAEIQQIKLITENQPALYLLGLLPPAANIIALETYYLKTGKSASVIACGTLVSILAIMLYVLGYYLI